MPVITLCFHSCRVCCVYCFKMQEMCVMKRVTHPFLLWLPWILLLANTSHWPQSTTLINTNSSKTRSDKCCDVSAHYVSNKIESILLSLSRLIDGDVLGSGLIGVFQSGHVVVWDLRGSVAKVVGVLDELCRLARWAGPNTLLTGYLNGDVSVFHYKST